MAELQFPPRCPHCRDLLMDSAVRHCPNNTHCPWLRCRCGASVDQAGHSFLPPKP